MPKSAPVQSVQLWLLIFSELLPQHLYPSGFSATQWNILDQEISNPLLLLSPIVRTHFIFEKSKNGVHAEWLCATLGVCVWIHMTVSVCSPALRSVCYWQTGSSALLANTVLISAHRLCQPFALLVTFEVLPCPKQIIESECLLAIPTPSRVYKTIFILGVYS